MKKWPIGVLLLPLSFPACGEKKPVPPAAPSSSEAAPKHPAGFYKLTPEGQARWLAAQPAYREQEAQDARDRDELVRPAPADFKPEGLGRRLKLTLIPQKTLIHKGERFWYRVELKNVGSEAVRWAEPNSLFKSGDLGLSQMNWSFFIVPSGSKEFEAWREMRFSDGPTQDIVFPPGTDAAGKALWFKKLVAWSHKPKGLNLLLQPGETIVSRSWSQAVDDDATNLIFKGIDPDTATPGQFRELPIEFHFDKPGTYRIKVVFDDRPSPLNESHIRDMEKRGITREDQIKRHDQWVKEALGPIKSNTVNIEVVP